MRPHERERVRTDAPMRPSGRERVRADVQRPRH
jgi:hypothetical protein